MLGPLVFAVALVCATVLVRTALDVTAELERFRRAEGVSRRALVRSLVRLTRLAAVRGAGRVGAQLAYLRTLGATRSLTAAREERFYAQARYQFEVLTGLVSAAGELSATSTHREAGMRSSHHQVQRGGLGTQAWDPWEEFAQTRRSEERWGDPR